MRWRRGVHTELVAVGCVLRYGRAAPAAVGVTGLGTTDTVRAHTDTTVGFFPYQQGCQNFQAVA